MKGSKKIVENASYWDNRLSWASAIYFIASTANATIKYVLPIPESLWGGLSAVAGLVIIGSFVLCFKEMQRRSGMLFWRSVALFLILYLLSAVLIMMRGEPLDEMIKGTAFLTFVWWIPVGVFACSVIDKSILYAVWVKASYLISACCIAMYFFHRPPENDNGSTVYSMFFGFAIIVPLLIQVNEFLRKKTIWLLLLVLLETFMILIYANRGIFLSLIFFMVYKFAFESNSRFRKILAVFFLLLMTIMMLSSIQSIASAAVAFLDIWGYESRSLNMLAEGIVSDTSGRDGIWEVCFKMIKDRPFLGWGLGGEYYHLAYECFGTPSEDVTASGYNPHNGVIENFVCFGIVGGLVANFIVLNPLLHLKSPKDKNVHDLMLVFASASVIPICISASGFFITPAVAIFLYLYYRRTPLTC